MSGFFLPPPYYLARRHVTRINLIIPLLGAHRHLVTYGSFNPIHRFAMFWANPPPALPEEVFNLIVIQYPALSASRARPCRHPDLLENHEAGEHMQPATSGQQPAVRHPGDNSSSLRSARTNAQHRASILAGLSLTPHECLPLSR